MNKLLILLAAFSFSAAVASAQTMSAKPVPLDKNEHAGKAHQTPEQRADHKSQHLQKSLGLTAEQTAKVRQLYLTQAQEMQASKAKADASKAGRHAEMKAKHAQYDAQLKQILSADQYTKYSQERTERMNKHKQHMGQHSDKMKAKS